MECTKCAVLIYALCLRLTVLGNCTLDRNEFNRYPFVLKLVVDDVMLCHGTLITPKFFMSPFEPVKEVADLTKLNVIGQLYGEYGLICFDAIQPKYLQRTGDDRRPLNSVVGTLERGFDVTLNKPYLYTHLDDFDVDFMRKKMLEVKEFQCCIIPIFEDDSVNATVSEREVTYVGRVGTTAEFWKGVFCAHAMSVKSNATGSQTLDDDPLLDNSGECHDDVTEYYFFVYDPMESSTDFHWYRGAMIICNDIPLPGFITMQAVDPVSSTRVTMFEYITAFAQLLRDEAMIDWPKTNLISAIKIDNTTTATTANSSEAPVKVLRRENKRQSEADDLKRNDATRCCPLQSASILVICVSALSHLKMNTH